MALVVSIAVVASAIVLVRFRVNSVEPPNTVAGLPLDDGSDAAEVFLVVGVDGREYVDARTEWGRADSIGLVRVDTARDAVSVISVPRDLLVETSAGQTRLAELYSRGGPGAFVDAIRGTLGLEVDHYVEVGFDDFAALVDEVGGLRLRFPTAQRDQFSGHYQAAGCRTLGGDEALAFVRARHLEFNQSGAWKTDGTSDLGRVRRLQTVVGALVSAALDHVQLDPAPVIRRFLNRVVVDTSFTADDALRLVRALEPTDLRLASVTLPVDPTFSDDQLGLEITPGAAIVISSFVNGSPLPPSAVPPTNPSALAGEC